MKLGSRSRGRLSGRRLGLESLENRQMLSATVTAVLSGGNLTLTGNKNDAYVEVHETVAGTETFLITGLSGTKITYGSSTASSQTISGVTGSLTANLPGTGGGTQTFELDSLNTSTETDITGNLAITMGNANNSVTLQGPELGIGGTASIAAGSGNQTINVGKVENIGGGPDVFVDGGPMSITTGAGNSNVTVVDTAVYEGSLCISLSNGNGNVVVGSEADTVGTDVLVGGNLTTTLGNGNGNVHIVNSDVENNLVVKTGNGNANICIGALVSHSENNFSSIHFSEIGPTGFDVTVGGYLYVSTCPGNATVTVLDTTIGFDIESEVVRPSFISQSALNPGDMAIELGSGNDKVTIGSAADLEPPDITVDGNLYVDIGSGNETASIQSAFVLGNIEMSHQAGNTTITLGNSPVSSDDEFFVETDGNVTITTSTGNASITVGGVAEGDGAYIAGALSITTGSGNATISLTDSFVGGNTTITTGSGNSNITLLDDDLFSNLAVTLGVGGTSGGSSSVSIRSTTVDGSTTLAGGGNASLYYDGTDDFIGGISYSHFKKVTT